MATTAVSALKTQCARDNCPNLNFDQTLLRCSRCKNALYCDTICQKSHWPLHKKVCHLQIDNTKIIDEEIKDLKKNVLNINNQIEKTRSALNATLSSIQEGHDLLKEIDAAIKCLSTNPSDPRIITLKEKKTKLVLSLESFSEQASKRSNDLNTLEQKNSSYSNSISQAETQFSKDKNITDFGKQLLKEYEHVYKIACDFGDILGLKTEAFSSDQRWDKVIIEIRSKFEVLMKPFGKFLLTGDSSMLPTSLQDSELQKLTKLSEKAHDIAKNMDNLTAQANEPLQHLALSLTWQIRSFCGFTQAIIIRLASQKKD